MGIKSLFTRHAKRPDGITGRLIAKMMWTKTKESNHWTVSLLNISPDDKILEIGFGLGHTVKKLTEMAHMGFVGGIDISETMIDSATKLNFEEIEANQVELKFGSVENIPFDNESFNKVFAINVIYLWADLHRSLSEIKRVLMRNGKVALYLADKKTMKMTDLESDVFTFYKPEDVKQALSGLEFQDIRIEHFSVLESSATCVLARK